MKKLCIPIVAASLWLAAYPAKAQRPQNGGSIPQSTSQQLPLPSGPDQEPDAFLEEYVYAEHQRDLASPTYRGGQIGALHVLCTRGKLAYVEKESVAGVRKWIRFANPFDGNCGGREGCNLFDDFTSLDSTKVFDSVVHGITTDDNGDVFLTGSVTLVWDETGDSNDPASTVGTFIAHLSKVDGSTLADAYLGAAPGPNPASYVDCTLLCPESSLDQYAGRGIEIDLDGEIEVSGWFRRGGNDPGEDRRLFVAHYPGSLIPPAKCEIRFDSTSSEIYPEMDRLGCQAEPPGDLTPIYVHALTGQLTYGGVQDLAKNDSRFIHVETDNGTFDLAFGYHTTNLQPQTQLSFSYRVAIPGDSSATLRVRNHETGLFEVFGTVVTTLATEMLSFSAPNGATLPNYVAEDGRLETRLEVSLGTAGGGTAAGDLPTKGLSHKRVESGGDVGEGESMIE